MNKEKAQAALLTGAIQNGIPLETVIREIEKAIAAAYQSAQKDPAALEKWRKIPCKGEVPSALEMISYLGEVVMGLQDKPNSHADPNCAETIKDFYC